MGDVTRPAANALGVAQTLKRGGQSCRRSVAQALVIVLLAVFLALAASPAAHAVTEFHWIGAGTGGQTGTDPADQTTRWNNTANWQEGMRPGPADRAILAFTNAGYANLRSTVVLSGLGVDGPSAEGALHIMDGADLSTAENYGIIVGNGAQGKVVQTGGSVTVNGFLVLGSSPGGSGTYLLQGGTLTVPSSCQEHIGEHGTGVFTQTGGTHAVEGFLYVGQAYGPPGGAGVLNMEGGTLRVGAFYLGMGASSGSLSVTNSDARIEIDKGLYISKTATINAVPGTELHLGPGRYPIFQNDSSDEKALADVENIAFFFDSDTSLRGGLLEVAGTDLGPTVLGFKDNFVMGSLVLGATNPVVLWLEDYYDNGNRSSAEALYVHNITIYPGSTLEMEGLNVYYDGSFVNHGTVLNGTPVFVPEPATMALLALGSSVVGFRRIHAVMKRKHRGC